MPARDATAGNAYVRLRRVIDAIDGVLMLVGCLMLFALMLVVVADVSLRYLFNAPLQWSYEVISSYLMPGLFFMAVSHTLKANAHVSVDILHNYVGRRTRYVFEAICSVVAPKCSASTSNGVAPLSSRYATMPSNRTTRGRDRSVMW